MFPLLHQIPKKRKKVTKNNKNYKDALVVSSSRVRSSKTEMSEVVVNKVNPDALMGTVGPQRKGIFKYEPVTNLKLCFNNKYTTMSCSFNSLPSFKFGES